MIKNCFDWRQDYKTETVIEEFDFSELNALKNVYPHGYHGVDKKGRPIYIEQFAKLDFSKLWAITTEERMVRHYVQEYEKLMKWRFPACSLAAGKKVEQGFTVMDLTDSSVVNK